jgi:hypothetical protein
MNCAPLELRGGVSGYRVAAGAQTYTLKEMNSLARLSGGREVSSSERLKPPKPPESCSRRWEFDMRHSAGLGRPGGRSLHHCFSNSFSMPKLHDVIRIGLSNKKSAVSNTYGTATASEAPRRARPQNMRRHIWVRAVLPRLLIRLFLILVAMAGWVRFANLSFEFHFLHF